MTSALNKQTERIRAASCNDKQRICGYDCFQILRFRLFKLLVGKIIDIVFVGRSGIEKIISPRFF